MSSEPAEAFDRILTYLRGKRSADPSFADVVALAEITAESMQAFFESMDSAVYRELREIASYIVTMKREISMLQANDLKQSRIPSAGMELDAVVRSTEKATNSIMECAEAIMAADPSDHEAYQATVNDNVMQIFEACSFQDLTGQRVSKVVETLQHIESRVSRFAEAINTRDVQGFVDAREQAREERRKKLLLNGPQMDGQGVDQSDVDALFGGEGAPAKAAPAPAPAARAEAAAPKPAAPAAAAPEKPAAAAKPAAPKSEDELPPGGAVSQDDIDALFG